MLATTTKCWDYTYKGVKSLIDWEASYVKSREQGIKNKLSQNIRVLSGVSFSTKELTFSALRSLIVYQKILPKINNAVPKSRALSLNSNARLQEHQKEKHAEF